MTESHRQGQITQGRVGGKVPDDGAGRRYTMWIILFTFCAAAHPHPQLTCIAHATACPAAPAAAATGQGPEGEKKERKTAGAATEAGGRHPQTPRARSGCRRDSSRRTAMRFDAIRIRYGSPSPAPAKFHRGAIIQGAAGTPLSHTETPRHTHHHHAHWHITAQAKFLTAGFTCGADQ